MLNYIWCAMIVASVVCALLTGSTSELSNALVESGASSVELLLTMAGILCLWSGIMKIASESGLCDLFARAMSPLLHPLFPRLDRDGEAFKSISMNVSSNLLGLGNAATPFGLKAMNELHRLDGCGNTASDEMVIFVVMNTASMQLLPTTIAGLRQAYGSENPFEIMVPVWISSALSLAVALVLAVTGNRASGRNSCRLRSEAV